jgi:hypothetical protein
MTTDRLLMVLNKTDMLPADNRAAHVKKAEERVRRGLKGTKFAEAPMVAVAACPGAEEGAPPLGITQLVRVVGVCVVRRACRADGARTCVRLILCGR